MTANKVYIQSRKAGLKRWETHLPPVLNGFMESARTRAEKQVAQFNEQYPAREYRVFPPEFPDAA